MLGCMQEWGDTSKTTCQFRVIIEHSIGHVGYWLIPRSLNWDKMNHALVKCRNVMVRGEKCQPTIQLHV